MSRNQYFKHLLELFERHIESQDPRNEWDIECEIMNFIETNSVPEPNFEPDYNAPTQAEEAERMHRIQRDLK